MEVAHAAMILTHTHTPSAHQVLSGERMKLQFIERIQVMATGWEHAYQTREGSLRRTQGQRVVSSQFVVGVSTIVHKVTRNE